ncbi:acetyl-CoA carboxylase biotin carboxylase subunit [Aneurinibacillus migulanus]|uniref:biotin carboxylase n=1 Tax=Aneurinibacillus migulanus TaxID=47500 RepID=A0A0D1WB84_ANEMI|nr:acetyl-CoA carboxylase biotin carboxylase subunit [Aneurinibacillus migulanus]KIV55815.1 biotin carboxylase [Aneurinibacillus migulanus]KON98453.1 biotin carboxylase [Aneurinibacillus migulanus]MED0891708.1 acetyl-CoA carboxylase biotin carboxylase subunit [Aneurinibacillus migulanus]MED1617552.1 acetyl-CoA carboxylase biotin carboxylase subunit [Aneurinibacillus migulanus]
MKTVLIANRGEIARRIIRTCKAKGIRTIAVHSEADASMPFVREADAAVVIGPPPVAKSYLNMEAILQAAKEQGADAIHPGYGLLSENGSFARRCAEEGIVFIGPHPEVMEDMGDKIRARARMIEAGVPVVPGYNGSIADAEEACHIAAGIGYPVMLKASAGGGGIGMQVCENEEEVRKAFQSAKGRAKAYFGNDDMFIEKYIEEPHHIEVQIAGDKHGQIIHLFERECSIQRRHQKVIEESPSPFLDNATREAICQTAVQAAQAVGYTGVGTVEFIMNGEKEFFFLEMNTRLQVEHPVTEAVTGFDLVEMQLAIAEEKALTFSQEEVMQRGHAIELRIYAEDPVTFMPSPGTISRYEQPEGKGIRVDDAVESGSTITPFYDPMIGKLIVSGSTRTEAITRAEEALTQYVIEGIKTNLPMLGDVLHNETFAAGIYTTQFVQQMKRATNK